MAKAASIFARLFRPSAKSAIADPWASAAQLFGVVPTISGIAVSAEAAIRVPAVAAAIRLISEAAATLPRKVKRVGADGTETDVRGHWADGVLNGRANDWTSGFELIRDLMVDALSDDRGGLVWANRVGGRVAEFIRYRPSLITVDFDYATGEPSYRLDNAPVDAGSMVHVRPVFNRAPLTLARESIGLALVLERHASTLFGKGARPSGVLTFAKGMGEEAVKKSRAAWQLTHEAEGETGKTAILYDGAEFKPLAFASTDAQFIENRRFQILEIARAFRVPPSMLFDLDRATWGNVEQMGKEFLIYCLEPWLCALEGALSRVLFRDEPGLVVRFDRDDMTRADLGTRATTINSLIASEVLNPNEGRSWLGMGPYDGGETFGNRNINPDQGGRPTKQEAPSNGA